MVWARENWLIDQCRQTYTISWREGVFQKDPSQQVLSVSDMPIVKSVAEKGKNLVNFKETAFFGVQHILRTNIPLFQYLISILGANPNYIFLNSKGYPDFGQ